MPFTPEADDLERVIQQAFAEPEIHSKVGSLDARRHERLREKVRGQREQIWGSASPEIDQFNRLEAKLSEDEAQLATVAPPLTPGLAVLRGFVEFLSAVPGLLIIAYVILGFTVGWGKPFAWLVTPIGGGVVGFTFVLGLALYLAYRPRNRAYLRLKQELVTQAESRLSIEDTRKRFAGARDTVLQAVRDKGVLRLLRGLISSELTPLFATTLQITAAPGLHGAYSPNLEVDTPAHARLKFLLRELEGSSIGIAGPRGAGKSSLINSVCREDVKQVEKRDVLGVATSAPVEYQARDFLLHLFASVCHCALERDNAQHSRFDWKDVVAPLAPARRLALRWALYATMIAFVLAGTLLAASLGLATFNLDAQLAEAAASSRASTPQASPSSVHAVTPPAEAVPQVPPSSEHVAVSPPTRARSDAMPGRATPAPTPYLVRFGKELEIKPGTMLSWAWWLFVASAIGFTVLSSQASRSPRPRQSELDSPARPFKLLVDLAARIGGIFRAFAEPPPPLPRSRALQDASTWLTEIKFQQSYTSDWTGSLKLPLGVEGSSSSGRALAQQQMTLPEIVDGFTRFLKQLVLDQKYTVIIGIDELDKLESDDKAQRFLNEIKAIFGIRGVFYLISVSENAMSNFERRGLPFRDAFDSAFDELIAVNYLDFATARQMLAERVLGLPVQFQALCYCLSGGLARELIRSCRDLVEQSTRSGQAQDLEQLAGLLIGAELVSRARGICFTAERIDAEPWRGELLELLQELEAGVPDAQMLHAKSRALAAFHARPDAADVESKATAASKLNALAQEMASYASYLATLLEFFSNALDHGRMAQALRGGRVDSLARALQALSVSPGRTRSLLNLLGQGV